MKNFLHFDAKSVDDAASLLSKYEEKAKVIAGGVCLLGIMKRIQDIQFGGPNNQLAGISSPEVLVNVKTIPNLDYITEDAEGLKIGALATLDSIEVNAIVKGKYKLLADAIHTVASWQIRNMATIAGNLLQDVRCWYYKGPFFCYRKGGTICYSVAGDNTYNAILGGKVCFAVCPSDTAIALTALDAKVVVQGKAGKRTIPMGELYTVLRTTLKPDEVLTEVQVPPPKPGTKGVFLKFRKRKAIDFAISSVAAVITIAAGAVTDSRIVLGGVAPTPYRATKAEDSLKGKAISESVAEDAAKAAVADATPLSMNAYLVPITKTLVKRAILA